MSLEAVVQIECCRACASTALDTVFDLGSMPLSDGFCASATEPDARYPLQVLFCADCGLAQLAHTVAPTILFADDYPYYSSYSDTVVENARANVAAALARHPVSADGLVVEIASNDGYLLQHVRNKGIPVLGIDPAAGPVAAARKIGIDTKHAFFSSAVATELCDQGLRADLIFANNVLAHVAELSSFVEGLFYLLRDDGLAIIEVPYLRRLLDHGEFDTIYHEHLCYFSVTALERLFRRHGLFLNDVELIDIHGGSLRLFVERRANPSLEVRRLLDEERADGLDTAAAFQGFAHQVQDLRAHLNTLLRDAKARGASIAAYGAAAKGTILLNSFEIGPDLLDFVVDRNPHKQGLYVPGVKLPIKAPETLDRQPPDLLLVLAWNHKDEIMRQLSAFAQDGGKFVIPIPEVQIVGA